MSVNLIKVSTITNDEETYLIARTNFVKNGGKFKTNINDYLSFQKNKLGLYEDVFKLTRNDNSYEYFKVVTTDPGLYQACTYKPYESLAYKCQLEENKLIYKPIGCPFNDALVNNCGENQEETHLATIYDLHYMIVNNMI